MIDNIEAIPATRRPGEAPCCVGCGRMTQSKNMSRWGLFSLILLVSGWPAAGQSQEESLRVYTEHPRLFLRPQRLRLLQREKERRSLRWQQFELLMAGRAPMPETGFALALYYRASQDQDSGRRAVAWALGPGTDLRQLALIFDWCQDLLSPAQSKTLAAKLAKGIEQSRRDRSIAAARSRMLAAIALGDHLADVSNREVEEGVLKWWRGEIAPALKAGRDAVPRADLYALYELLHAVRDNLQIDLRESAPAFFKTLPIYELVSYYPATYPAPEGEYRVPSDKDAGEPDLRRAVLARAAELSMVPYDINAPESQILQGWLMHDNFIMRGTFGVTYEFLWANPYHPGLSYYLAPLVFHDEQFGRLFVRSSWDESAHWLGYFDGGLQLFQDGKVTLLNPELSEGPIALDAAVVFFGKNAQKFQTMLQEDEEVFVLGLHPRRVYQIEVDDEELTEDETDRGGILQLKLPHKVQIGVRLRDVRPAIGPTKSDRDGAAGALRNPRSGTPE